MYVSHPSAAHPLRPHGCRRPLMKNACHAKMPLIVWHRCSLVRPWVGGVVDVRPRKTAHYNKTFYRNAVTIHPSIHPSFHLSICFRVHLPPEGKKKGEGGGGGGCGSTTRVLTCWCAIFREFHHQSIKSPPARSRPLALPPIPFPPQPERGVFDLLWTYVCRTLAMTEPCHATLTSIS